MSHSPGLIDAWEIADGIDNADQAGNLWRRMAKWSLIAERMKNDIAKNQTLIASRTATVWLRETICLRISLKLGQIFSARIRKFRRTSARL
jgi:hypothetical protein